MTFGVGAFIAYMLFIIWKLARQSKAGRFGTFVLFLGLAFGMVGFVAKERVDGKLVLPEAVKLLKMASA